MIAWARKTRSVDRVVASLKELQASVPPDPVSNLSLRARAAFLEWRNRASPADQYAALTSDESPWPEMPGSRVEIKDSDDPETLLTKMQDAYRAELESGAKLLEMLQVFKKLQGAVS